MAAKAAKKQCIADAWEHGYTDEKDRTKCRTKLDLYAAVDAVKVTTRTHRWTFPVTRTADDWVVGDGTRKDPKLDRGNVLTNGKLNQHWLWLATWAEAPGADDALRAILPRMDGWQIIAGTRLAAVWRSAA